MKPNKLNEKVIQKLLEFDTLENINPSTNWDTELNLKLQLNSTVKPNFITKYNLILVCVVLLNCSLILYSMLYESKQTTNRTMNLELISNELLITSN